MDEFTKELLSLLDHIEVSTNEDEIIIMCKERFKIAEKYGYEVVLEAPNPIPPLTMQ